MYTHTHQAAADTAAALAGAAAKTAAISAATSATALAADLERVNASSVFEWFVIARTTIHKYTRTEANMHT